MQYNSLIVGPGAIGSLVCAQSQQLGPVYVYQHRANQELATILKSGAHNISLPWQLLSENKTQIDIIWICCKAFHSELVTRTLLGKHPDAVAILLHNGLGPQQALSKEFGNRVVWGATTCAALKSTDGLYEQTSFGQTNIGLLHNQSIPQNLFQALTEHSSHNTLNIIQSSDIESILWQKILVNAAINPITATHQIKNGELIHGSFDEDIFGICHEIELIMAALNLKPISNAIEIVRQVATISAQNRSSMAEDIRLKRQTEINFINGYLIKTGEDLNICTPFLRKWYKAIELKSNY